MTQDAQILISQNASDPAIYKNLENILVNSSGKFNLPERFRALFSLKNLKTDQAVHVISKAFGDDSALLKHELAYCLGQIGLVSALPVLEGVLRDTKQEAMVRHEAAEAMGAIGDQSAIAVLEEFLTDEEVAVSETCELALSLLRNRPELVASNVVGDVDVDQKNKSNGTVYTSVDPAPPFDEKMEVGELKTILLNERKSMYERYRAMFSLRNDGSDESVDALAEGLRFGQSALFRHEVAFVFGQMQNPRSVAVLKEVLARQDEVDMVRHECAEALGSIATEECLPELKNYLTGGVPAVVKESCEVALDMYEYENDMSSFNYAVIPDK